MCLLIQRDYFLDISGLIEQKAGAQEDAEYAEFVRQQNAGLEGTPDNSTRSRGKGAFRKFFGKIFRTQR